MQKYTKENFPEIVSQPNWFWTWIIRVLFVFILSLLLLFFYIQPILLYVEDYIYGGGAFLFFAIYYPVVSLLLGMFIRYLKRIKGGAIIQIRVDEKGIHYLKRNGETVSILYAQLHRFGTPIVFDVFSKSIGRYGRTELRVNINKEERDVPFFATDVFFAYYVGNIRELRSLFIQGIVLFRPDLRISPSVYSNFHIHPDSFRFNTKEFWRTLLFVLFFIILLLIGIDYYMRHRFGASPFF